MFAHVPVHPRRFKYDMIEGGDLVRYNVEASPEHAQQMHQVLSCTSLPPSWVYHGLRENGIVVMQWVRVGEHDEDKLT
jgi:hypothetical protein